MNNHIRYQQWVERLEDAAFSGNQDAMRKLIAMSKRINGETAFVYPWPWLKSETARECA